MIPDLSKARITGVLNMPGERETSVKPYIKVPDHLSRKEQIVKKTK